MEFGKMKFSKKYQILRILFLFAYLGCMLVLVIESLTPGKKSAQKSNAVGNVVGGFINDLGGDQAKEVDATSCTISVKDNKHVFSIGEKTSLNVITLPKEATHTSYEYISSDETIAVVSKIGDVTFLKEGSVTIKVVNMEQKEITSEITFTSLAIDASNLTTTIDAPFIEENNYYELEKGKSYRINNIIEPDNTTNKKVVYNISDTSKISISNDIIYAKDVSSDLIKIESIISNITKEIFIKVIEKEVVVEKIELESISSYDITKYSDQTSYFTPTVKYNPTYTSAEFKGYTLESLDTSIVTVSGNNLSITGAVGSANIVITSTYDESIFATIKVVVKARSSITDYTINYSKVMYENQKQTIYIRNIKPSDAKIRFISYESSDSNVLEITNNGVIKAKSIGSASITINVTDTNNNILTKSITIECIEKPLTIVDDFDIDYLDIETPILFINKKTNLNDYFKVTKFYNNNEEINPENKNYYYNFDVNYATINSSYITPIGSGLITGFIVYKNSDDSIIAKEISLYVISDFNITKDTKSINYNMKVNETLTFKIEDEIDEQKYSYTLNGKSIRLSNINKQFKVRAIDSGSATLTIIPSLGDVDLTDFKKTITFNIEDIYTTQFQIRFKDKDNNYIDYVEDYELLKGQNITYEIVIDEATTKYNVNLENDNNFIVRYYTITPTEIGSLKLAFTEVYSDIRHVYNFKVKNYIHVNEDKLYTIKGDYEIKENSIEIVNGKTVQLELEFYSDSTYKNVVYKSSEESVIKVFSDGTISPQKQGSAVITMEVNDGTEFKSYELNFTVHKKNVIDDMNSFMYYIRKGLGHFGAFLILGIFATLSFMFFFRRRLLPVGIILNFALGFLFSGFTEFLQTKTPGRVGCMSDILIDYSGFLVSTTIITVVLLLVFIIKYYKSDHKFVGTISITNKKTTTNEVKEEGEESDS